MKDRGMVQAWDCGRKEVCGGLSGVLFSKISLGVSWLSKVFDGG